MGELVSMETKPTSSAVLQTMLHAPPPLWQNKRGSARSYPGECAQPSIECLLVPTPFQQQSAEGGFKDVQPSSHFQVASLGMLFETGMFYMMMINIRHVSPCFFKLSVKLSGNINSCLFFIVVMPLLQIRNRSMVLFTQIGQYHALAICTILYMLTTDSCVHHTLSHSSQSAKHCAKHWVYRDVQRSYSQISESGEKSPEVVLVNHSGKCNGKRLAVDNMGPQKGWVIKKARGMLCEVFFKRTSINELGEETA